MYTTQPQQERWFMPGAVVQFAFLGDALEDARHMLVVNKAFQVRITGPGFAVRLKRKAQCLA